MRISELMRMLSSLKVCIDSPWLLKKVMGLSLEAQDWFHRFARFSPALLDVVAGQDSALQDKGRLYSMAVSYFRFGNIFKLTGSDRTNLADDLVYSLVREFESPRIMEVGVSDGSSALGILENRKMFGDVVLTDRYNRFYYQRRLAGRLFHDGDGNPQLFKLGFLSFDVPSPAYDQQRNLVPIETANPVLRREFGITGIRRFDMFVDRLEDEVQIMKCANLLNCSYFSDKDILGAVDNLGRSLVDGGYLVVSQNNEKYAQGEAVFALKKSGADFSLVHDRNEHEAARLYRQA